MQANYLVVDLEGTCWNDGSVPKREWETIEIGAVIVNAVNYEIMGEFGRIVQPVKHLQLSSFCINLTGITQEMVDKAQLFPVVFRRFLDWVHGFSSSRFCSWGRYDRNQFDRDCSRHGIENSLMDHLNLSSLFTEMTGKRRSHRKAMKYFGLKSEGSHHRGLDDAKNASKMLPFLVKGLV